ncbi:MAG: OmpA family protein [Flavobacteriia bacterium]|jgi:chemotaxis protein MotB
MLHKIFFVTLTFALVVACVPAKKYNELVEREKICSEELVKYKNTAISNEDKAKELEAKLIFMQNEVQNLKEDTLRLSETYKILQVQYDRLVIQNLEFEKKLEKDKQTRIKQTGTLQNDLDSKNLELQRKEDALMTLETELKQKQRLLVDREKKVTELEEALKRKDEGIKSLKTKVASALRAYENKGLTVVEKNGKIYVSLDAKLLFQSGSTVVEEGGKKAIVDLAKVLEKEKDLEIIVEGHTDNDKLESASYPKSNWELSVLRATSVVEIMTKNSKMDPKILMAAGRSEFHPIDAKDKAKNRRIEVIISPNLNALFEMINK